MTATAIRKASPPPSCSKGARRATVKSPKAEATTEVFSCRIKGNHPAAAMTVRPSPMNVAMPLITCATIYAFKPCLLGASEAQRARPGFAPAVVDCSGLSINSRQIVNLSIEN